MGSYAPNAFGLFDMHGNVWQWVADRYAEDHYSRSPLENPQGPSTGEQRVVRGGSWFDGPWNARASHRNGPVTSIRFNPVGFRVACVPAAGSN